MNRKSSIILEHLRKEQMDELLKIERRLDGRSLSDYRELKIETNLIKKAEGSALVSLGNTQVIAGVKVEVDRPFPDMPDKGLLICNAEVLPLASAYAEPGPPDENAIELARVVDRGIRESEMIDLKELVIKPGEKVYAVFVDVSVLNVDGNLFDATSYAVVSALLTSKVPKYELEGDEIVKRDEYIPLPVNTIPISITMARIGDAIIVDPTAEEESCMDARTTMTVDNEHNVCAVQKGGSGTFSPEQVKYMVDLAINKSEDIREIIKGVAYGEAKED
ncbi:MAG: exosome complex protein Rrp42 [Candidatus Nitrosothermus koennekii]|nr:MAG: exosome complex protein Rrp42 [Candidatus Nitrosothermus koennekii]